MAATETLVSVRTEISGRGFGYLQPARANRLINDAYFWLVKLRPWPFREAIATGPAPLTIADLGPIATVKDTAQGGRKLHPLNRSTLEERFPDITTPGTPCFYYVEGNAVKTTPAGGTLQVRHWRTPTKLVADGDPLIVPDEWVQLVIDRALWRGYLDSDNFEAAAAISGAIDAALIDMMRDLLTWQSDEPEQVEVYGGEGR